MHAAYFNERDHIVMPLINEMKKVSRRGRTKWGANERAGLKVSRKKYQQGFWCRSF